MADRETIFMLDDVDDGELGGFNDAPVVLESDHVEGNKEETQDNDSEKVDADSGGEEPVTREEKPDKKKSETEAIVEKGLGKKEEGGRNHDAPAVDVNTMVAAVAKLTEQNNKLVEQLNKKTEQQPETQKPPEKPVFTQNQWDDDPQGCNEALYEYYDQKKAYENRINEETRQATEKQRQQGLKAAQEDSWKVSVEIMPELRTNEKARKAWSAVFNNAEAGFARDPNGPIKATTALRKFMAEKNLSFDQKTTKPQTTDGKNDSAETARRAAEDEAARQRRVRSQAMHTGGRGGKSTVNLTPEQKSVCRQMNISEQAYADSLAALGGGR